MNKTAIAVASVCIIIAIVFPLISYVYFENRFNEFNVTLDSYESRISDLLQENEKLKQENENLIRIEDNPYFTGPYLVTRLGWYLHNSSDPITANRNSFTIYGIVSNIGSTNATNCKPIINFYNNATLLQSSEINLGLIMQWSYESVRTDIRCPVADSVTNIEVTPKWS